MMTRSPSHRFSFTFARVMTTATDLPSGEICGSLRFAMRRRSDGCQRSAWAAAATNNSATAIRFIVFFLLRGELYNRAIQEGQLSAPPRGMVPFDQAAGTLFAPLTSPWLG